MPRPHASQARLPRRGKLATLIVLGGLAALLLGVTAVAASQLPHIDGDPVHSESRDETQAAAAAAYAVHNGVSVETAAAELEAQDRISRELARLAQLYPEFWAGAWLEHDPELVTVVRLVRDVPLSVVAMVESHIPGRLTIRVDADATLLDLMERTEAATVALADLIATSQVSVTPVIRESEVVIVAASSVIAETAESQLPTGLYRLVVAPSSTFTAEDSVHGGGKVTDFSDFCTTGFTVKHRTSGVKGVTTAGHCPNNLTYTTGGSQTINFVSEYNAYWGDGQWHSLGSGVSVEPKFYVNSTTLRTLTSFRFRHEISVGQTLCSFGRGTNSIICDDVYSVGSACGGNSYMVLMKKRQATGGDSGAPWFSGSIGYGTHKGYTWLWGNRDCFSTMDLIWSTMNLSPLTG